MKERDFIMDEIVDRIRSKREQLGYSYQDLAELTGMTKSTLQRYETGDIKNIPLSRIKILASALQTTPEWIMGWNIYTPKIEDNDNFSLVMLPIVGRICCGNGTLAYEEIEGYEPTPKEWLNGGDYFYLRAKGDSMMGARIYDGDLLLIRRQPDVENGQIAAVLIEDDAMLKKVYKNNGQLVLQSENPAYPPIFVPPAEGKIIGKLQKIVINM